MKYISRVLAGAGLLALASGCGQAAYNSDAAESAEVNQAGASEIESVVEEAAAAAMDDQTYAAQTELAGYYMPASTVAVGSVQLNHIALGMQFEFEAYFANEPNSFPPLTVWFDDISSPTGVGELGNTYYEVNHIFEPSHYAVTDETLAFWGQHEILGTIEFNGTFDAAQVQQMQDGYPENAMSALTGTMKVGDQTFENVAFQGWLGD